MGFDFTSDVDTLDDPREYFARYAAQRKAWLADKAGFTTTIDDEGVALVTEREKVSRERQVTILEPKRRIEGADLGVSAKRVWKAATAMGLQVSLWVIVVDVSPVLYVKDSEDGEHVAGDVLFEGYIGRRYVVEARHPEYKLGFQAFFLGKGAEGKTGSFESAHIADPVGVLCENWADYTKDKVIADAYGWSKERRIQEGMIANARINDGTDRTEHERWFFTGGDFTTWFDEWLVQKGLEPITIKRKPKATDAELLAGADWVG